MGRPLTISNTRKGLERDVEAFLLPQDAYPTIEDFYMFRGRIVRRKGIEKLGPGNQIVSSTTDSPQNVGTRSAVPPDDVVTNTITFDPLAYRIGAGTLSITDGITTFTDDGEGNLIVAVGFGLDGTINYCTGDFTATFTANNGAAAIIATFEIVYGLPCMGLRSREVIPINEEQLVAFDTIKANLFIGAVPVPHFEDITFYRTTNIPFSWTGTDADFFWTLNYQNAFFASNYIRGFQAFTITAINNNATATITFAGALVFPLGSVIGVTNVLAAGPGTINGKFGTVTASAAGSVTVTIDTATSALNYTSGGILHAHTNSIDGDGIRWYDGTGWVNFSPPLSSDTAGTNVVLLMGALILVAYKGRMLALNTIEGTSYASFNTFRQRVRYSEVGTVFYDGFVPTGWPGGSQADAWRSDIVGRGGFIDAPTQEMIISAEFIKDTLIVFFERSTYQLRYTGDPTIPFIWEKINTELGAESTFSIVPFDRGVFAIGNYGVITCDSVNVQRIDQIIPDEVFNIHNNNDGVRRVGGIRDFTKQLVYWTFPMDFQNNDESPNIFPSRVLVYNYLDGSYSFFNDSLTCFGSFQLFNDIRWKDLKIPWIDYPNPWLTGEFEFGFPIIVAGNQQGFVFIFNQNQISNDPSLMISNITQTTPATLTIVNHNLQVGQFIQISEVDGMTQINGFGPIGSSSGSPLGIYIVNEVSDADNFTIGYIEQNPTQSNYGNTVPVPAVGFTAYTDCGVVALINNFNLTTTQFSPFQDDGLQVRLSYLDIFMEAAENGEYSINLYVDQEPDLAAQTLICSPITAQNQEKIWFRNSPNVTGQYVQAEITLSNLQMVDPDKSEFDLTIHAMQVYFDPGSRFMFGTLL